MSANITSLFFLSGACLAAVCVVLSITDHLSFKAHCYAVGVAALLIFTSLIFGDFPQ